MSKGRMKTRLWVGLIATYLVAAFSWWGYLQLHHAKQHHDLQLVHAHGQSKIISTANDEFSRTKRMIWLEGGTFIVLLTVALYRLWRSFDEKLEGAKREQNLLLSMTHELKTPIAGAKLSLETLQRHSLDPVVQSQVLERGLQDISRLDKLVTNVLAAARLSQRGKSILQPSFSSIDLRKLIQEVFETFSEDLKGRLRLESDVDQTIIRADAEFLRVALINLIQNALHYGENKPVLLRIEEVKRGLALTISDSGLGIPENESKRVFQKFYRATNVQTLINGTGLGLYIAKQALGAMRGSLTYRPNLPKGSIFTVTLPTP